MDDNPLKNQNFDYSLDSSEDYQVLEEKNDNNFKENLNRETRKNESSSMATASLVLGIISVLSFLFWYIALPSSVLAIVFGVKSSKRSNSKQGKAGMILGIIGGSLLVAVYVFIVVYLVGVNAFG